MSFDDFAYESSPEGERPPEKQDIVLSARGISKSFPGVRALDNVSINLRRGKLTALLGENGAGKSTLMNILAGVYPADAGHIILNGKTVAFSNPRQALECGISMIYQELNLLPNLTVAENIFIGREPVNRMGLINYAAMNENAAKFLHELELDIAPGTIVGHLRIGQQQVVEIAKALSYQPSVMIMDEPTSALSEHEVQVLFRLIGKLKNQGVAIAYITHKFEELAAMGDDAVIMRDGRVISVEPLAGLSRDAVVKLMIGRDLGEFFPRHCSHIGTELMRAEHISLRDANRPGEFRVSDVSLSLQKGEVLGIFGLMGAGRTELLETLFGLHPNHAQGTIFIDGKCVKIKSPMDAINHGLALAPEDRKREGVVLSMSVAANVSLTSLDDVEQFGLINSRLETTHVTGSIKRFKVKTPSIHQLIKNLSGGNQQKVILGKWLATDPKILLLDEPTRGIDVNTKQEIYELIRELSRDGLGVIMVSSELPEIMAVSDRIMVMCEGAKSADILRSSATEHDILSAAIPLGSNTTSNYTGETI